MPLDADVDSSTRIRNLEYRCCGPLLFSTDSFGIYDVNSYAVAQRTDETGTRIAVGRKRVTCSG